MYIKYNDKDINGSGTYFKKFKEANYYIANKKIYKNSDEKYYLMRHYYIEIWFDSKPNSKELFEYKNSKILSDIIDEIEKNFYKEDYILIMPDKETWEYEEYDKYLEYQKSL